VIDIVDGTKAMTRKDLVELIEQQTGMLDQADAALNDLRTELSEAKAEIERLQDAFDNEVKVCGEQEQRIIALRDALEYYDCVYAVTNRAYRSGENIRSIKEAQEKVKENKDGDVQASKSNI